MNVLLVSPYRGALFDVAGVRVQPLGLCYVAAALRAAGHAVRIDVLESPDVLPDLAAVDLVGISCNTVQFLPGLRVARAAHDAGLPVVMGGPHPTSCADEVLQSGHVDFAVRGEGEVTMVELLDGLAQGHRFAPARIAGLSWRDPESGRIVHSAGRPFVAELDRLPKPFREINWIHDRNGNGRRGGNGKPAADIPLVTTRGCPYGCKFCDVALIAGRKFRLRSVERVVDEMEDLARRDGATRLIVADDIINFDGRRLERLCRELIRRDLGIDLWVMGRADRLVDHPDTAPLMAAAGIDTMFLGIESPNKRILADYGKGGKSSAATSEQAVSLLRDNGIETWGAFIMGSPRETREDIEATIQYAKHLDLETAQFTVLTPYPGTRLWAEVENRLITRDWNLYDCMHAVFTGDHLAPKEIEGLCRRAWRQFYLQPRRLLRRPGARRNARNGGRGSRPDLRTVGRIIKALKLLYS